MVYEMIFFAILKQKTEMRMEKDLYLHSGALKHDLASGNYALMKTELSLYSISSNTIFSF